MKTVEIKDFHLFCGIGGGQLGFQWASEEYKGIRGVFRSLGGIDADPGACENFRRITGAPAFCMDLFERRYYVAFHGKEPPEGWREVMPQDILTATEGEVPDVVFLSPPCKGFSGLLPEKSAKSAKYQALNNLTVRGIYLTLEAFRYDLPAFVILENVPRITSRGEKLLHTIKGVLESYGYVVPDGKTHDCGEVGGLGQRRRRFTLVARNPKKISNLIYHPPKQKLKSIGEIIGPMLMPDDPAAGPMHRLPNLQFKTAVRLALIPAGGDWRDLENIDPARYRLEYVPRGGGPYGVQEWGEPGSTVIGNASIKGSNAAAVADPRLDPKSPKFNHAYKIEKWDTPAGTVAGGTGPSSGATCISDPRLSENIGKSFNGSPGLMGVIDWNKPSQAVTGSASASSSNCPSAVADPRLPARDSRHPGVYRVIKIDEPAPCVTGTRFGSGAPAIADPRTGFKDSTHGAIYKVSNWDEPANTITGANRPNNGAISISDPRVGPKWRNGWKCTGAVGRINEWDKPTDTVIGHSSARGNGASCVADPRLNCSPRNGTMGVQEWDNPAATVVGAGDIHAGASAVSDPRIPADNEQGKWVIISLDGTWHRPLTTLELAALQSFPLTLPDGRPLVLAGNSDAKWREWIGNAVPPLSAMAWANTVIMSVLASNIGDYLMDLNGSGIWVVPVQETPEWEIVNELDRNIFRG